MTYLTQKEQRILKDKLNIIIANQQSVRKIIAADIKNPQVAAAHNTIIGRIEAFQDVLAAMEGNHIHLNIYL